MALTPFTLHDIAESLVSCVCAALSETATRHPELAGCPCRSCVVPGVPAFDACDGGCEAGPDDVGGQLSVSLARTWATTQQTFPAESRQVMNARSCVIPAMAAELVVTLMRCSPLPTPEGCPPSCEELDAAARQLHADTTTVFRAVLCCTPRTAPGPVGRRFIMGAQRVLGPEGGCVGVEQRVVVELPGCDPCEVV